MIAKINIPYNLAKYFETHKVAFHSHKCHKHVSSDIYKVYLEETMGEWILGKEEIAILTFMITLLGFLKALNFLKVYPKFGAILRLTYNVVFAASAFSVFFYSMIWFFAYGYYILGLNYGGHPDDEHG